ncbi:hypothetical protein PVAP13_9KG169200 [Panicum virgatum]|uniref:Uncharacterized protein n=1 Tax=Panicum virgatum TaxID=38727 RepID=A0A8T0NLT0_PANVG|nr:hypothetical protein PVAP13_9KG169200 [Panicum virgatum]
MLKTLAATAMGISFLDNNGWIFFSPTISLLPPWLMASCSPLAADSSLPTTSFKSGIASLSPSGSKFRSIAMNEVFGMDCVVDCRLMKRRAQVMAACGCLSRFDRDVICFGRSFV